MERIPASPILSASRDWWWIFDPRVSIRARTALLAGGALVAFTVLLVSLSGRLYRRTLENVAGASLETLAAQMSDKLDRTLYERYRTLQLAADLPVLRADSTSGADRRRLLETVQNASPDFAWIGWADAQGRLVATTNRLFEGTDASGQTWFRGAREYPHVGALHELPELTRELPASEDGQPRTRFLDLAVPVLDHDGRFAGVLAAHVHWTWTHGVQTSVISEAAAREKIGVTVYGPTGDVLLDSGASGWTRPPDAPALGEGRRFRGYLYEDTPGGSHYLTGYMHSRGYRDYRGLSWLTVVRQPVDRVFASADSLERTVAFCGFTLALLAAIIGWVLAGRHARRLRSMTAAADRIRTGDVLALLPRPRGENETALMCAAVGDLVEDLRAERDRLSEENERLTARDRARNISQMPQ